MWGLGGVPVLVFEITDSPSYDRVIFLEVLFLCTPGQKFLLKSTLEETLSKVCANLRMFRLTLTSF